MLKIVEEKDASPEEKKVAEVNTGTYCFDARKLWPQLQRITNDNAQGEYYLTDVIDFLVSAGEIVTAATCADSDETLGVNSRAQLAQAEAILRQRKNAELMAQGVTLIDPALSYLGDSDIGGGVNIGCGTITVNYDGHKKYRTTIKDGAFVGCNSNLVAPVVIGRDAYIGAGSTITKDVPEKALAVARARQFVKEDWVKKAEETK